MNEKHTPTLQFDVYTMDAGTVRQKTFLTYNSASAFLPNINADETAELRRRLRAHKALVETLEKAQAVIGQCDCIMDERGETKRAYYEARDHALTLARPSTQLGGEKT